MHIHILTHHTYKHINIKKYIYFIFIYMHAWIPFYSPHAQTHTFTYTFTFIFTQVLLIYMCRHLLFRLRIIFKGKLTKFLPLDRSIEAHMVVGIVYVLLVIVHVGSHVINFIKISATTIEQQQALLNKYYLPFHIDQVCYVYICMHICMYVCVSVRMLVHTSMT